MSQLQERITQFRKMANDDPDNELGHFRLGQLLLEAGQNEEAVQSLRRTLELSPQFSKVYQLLAKSLIALNRADEAVEVLQKGFAVADERGDNMPRDDMGKMLGALGKPVPTSKRPASGGDGFRCQRPGCMAGNHARRLDKPPMGDDVGKQIHEKVCADCWQDWLKNYSIKVINELRLDLSTERGQDEYDRYMREYLGLA
ncbi:MAG TPA: Fe(2+)-trafficking protein [Gemmataceae bacterium]|jgi:Fe-S cluster biosynthesis and repair protein YggX|nr:Fe(2+)-trafficking protein [Gemmataceae bacterium]